MAHHNTQVGQQDSAPVDPRGQAMRDAMWKGHGGFELALVPSFAGLAGWVADDYFNITPVLTIIFAIVGLGGAVANQYYRYMSSMEVANAERLATREPLSRNATDSNEPTQPFAPVEQIEVDMSIDFSDSELTS